MRGAISREWLWRFDGHAPEAIWASLADTVRFNEAAALPKHEVEEIAQPDGSVRYFGRCRVGPLRLAWREQPVNWVHAEWFEHCRYFENGPLKSLCAELRLVPTEDGCEGRYRIAAEPAGLLGSFLLRSGLFFKRAGAAFTKLADDARQYAAGVRATPFDFPPPRLPQGARQRAAGMVRRIETTPHGHGLAGRLAELVLGAQEVDLWHIRPLRLARAWRRPEREVIELCLQAVRAGLLDLQWSLLCPRCRIAKANVGSLDRLPRGAHCNTCNIDYEREFSRNVEASFRPAAAIRPIAGGEYCLFGPMSTPHIKVHVTVAAGTTRVLDARLSHGSYRLRTLEPGGELDLEWRAGGFPTVIVEPDERVGAGPAPELGKLALCNRAARPLTFVIEEREWVRDALSADRLSATQAFRDLFSDQVLRPGDEVSIGNVALMFTDLKGSTALYEAIGSARAYRLVRDHFALLAAVVREHDGSVVKTIGDAVMAAFADPVDAVAAALTVQARLDDFNRGDGPAITIKLGVHCGPCIAVTLNDRLDYFGSTVNLAARLQSESVGGDIVLSAEVFADPRVRELLRGQMPLEQSAALKGFGEPVSFYRLIPPVPATAAAQKIPAIARVSPAVSSGAASSKSRLT
ncbi:MAG: adenylate/guanylate cyclase domain-containing protein [Geminicoccaceae bacterium]